MTKYAGVINEEDGWVDINTTYSIPLGKHLKIFNTGRYPISILSSDLEPSQTDRGLTISEGGYIVAQPDSERLWMKAFDYHKATFLISNEPYLTYQDGSLDPRVYTGFQAVTVQPFTEANVKNGSQFEASSYVTDYPANGVSYTSFVTGDKPVLIKALDVQLTGEGAIVTLFSGGTFTGGTPIDIYNLSDDNPAEETIAARNGVTMVTEGTQISPELVVLGSRGQGQSFSPTGKVQGLDRRLKPNTTYLRKIESLDSTTQTLFAYTTWYEGGLSTEL